MVQTRFALILYFRMVAHKAACHTLSKAFFEINEDMVQILLMLEVLFTQDCVVSYWRKYVHEVLVNRLGGLSLPRKSVVRLTDHPDMTLDVYRGRKTTMQQNATHRIVRLKICSVVLLPALNPACSSAIISSAWGFSLFKMTFSMTLLE